MARRFLNQLSDGDSVDDIFLLTDKQLRANRNANLYLLASIRDCTGVLSGLMWNVTEDTVAHINPGDYVRVRGKVQLYQGTLQVIVTHLNSVPAEGLDPADFHPRSGVEVERLLGQLKEILLSIDDPPLKTLMECFLIDEALMRQFGQAPAGVKAHHAYHGGLLEHVVNILETARRIADLYPKIDLNLLLAGIFLHDIGKIRELGYESTFIYTDEGQLLGHLLIGVEILNEKVAEAEKLTGEKFPNETLLRLKHMILSHHGKLEYGSAKLPMTPEAIALHHLDNLDAKVHEFTRSIEDDPNAASNWTPFSNRLDRKLYKGVSTSDEQ
jgi:3'-5' exoribonuclease